MQNKWTYGPFFLCLVLLLFSCDPSRKLTKPVVQEIKQNPFLGTWLINSIRLGSDPKGEYIPTNITFTYTFLNDSIMVGRDSQTEIDQRSKYRLTDKVLIRINDIGEEEYNDIIKVSQDTLELFKVDKQMPVFFRLIRVQP